MGVPSTASEKSHGVTRVCLRSLLGALEPWACTGPSPEDLFRLLFCPPGSGTAQSSTLTPDQETFEKETLRKGMHTFTQAFTQLLASIQLLNQINHSHPVKSLKHPITMIVLTRNKFENVWKVWENAAVFQALKCVGRKKTTMNSKCCTCVCVCLCLCLFAFLCLCASRWQIGYSRSCLKPVLRLDRVRILSTFCYNGHAKGRMKSSRE